MALIWLSLLSLWAQLKTAFSFFYCPCCLSLPQRLVEGRAPAGQVALLFTVNSNSSTWGTDQEVWIVITLPADGHLCCVALTVCKYEGSPDGRHGLCRCRAPAPFVIGVEFKGKKHKKNTFFYCFLRLWKRQSLLIFCTITKLKSHSNTLLRAGII